MAKRSKATETQAPSDLDADTGAEDVPTDDALEDLEPAAVETRGTDPAIEIAPAAPEAVPEPEPAEQHYRTRFELKYMQDGQLVRLASGSIVNARTYDLEMLRQYGAGLEPCEAPGPYNSD